MQCWFSFGRRRPYSNAASLGMIPVTRCQHFIKRGDIAKYPELAQL